MSGMNFIKVYIQMTTSVRLFISCDFLACEPVVGTLSTSFWHTMSRFILDKLNIKISEWKKGLSM